MYGNPENQIRLYILVRDVQKPVNLQFDFQGCQKLHVRVAISQKANEIDLPDTTKIVTKLLINAATVLLLLGDLPTLDLYCRQSCEALRRTGQLDMNTGCRAAYGGKLSIS